MIHNINLPAAVYLNSFESHKQILKENRRKSGVYRWTNLTNGKSYVGSSVDLSIRLSKYYSEKYLKTKLNTGNSAIYNAILKYGHSNFKLEILEYCEPPCTIFWEQSLLDFLKPGYNILGKAGSSLGFNHSEETKTLLSKIRKGKTHLEETKAKMSEARKGFTLSKETKKIIGEVHRGKIVSEETKTKMSEARKGIKRSLETKTKISEARKGKIMSEETKTKISAALKGENSPNFGKITPKEVRAKISAAKGQQVKVMDKDTNEVTTYSSGRAAAIALGCSDRTVRLYIDSQKLYKGRWKIELG